MMEFFIRCFLELAELKPSSLIFFAAYLYIVIAFAIFVAGLPDKEIVDKKQDNGESSTNHRKT
jgi:hypothetical protein